MHEIFRDRLVEKSYQALVCGHVQVDAGTIELPLQKDHVCPPFMRVSTPKSELAAAQVVQDLQHHGWKKIMRRKPKPSTTEFTVLSREYIGGDDDDKNDDKKLPVTRVALKPITGRTHQLRVHCAALGHPIVGDPTYGVYGEASANGGILEEYMDTLAPHRASLSLQKQINALQVEKMCLHAKELSFKHPVTGEEMKWEAKPPF
jgi:23S rRNA-/tRNA-specific pseudouridylate synthase